MLNQQTKILLERQRQLHHLTLLNNETLNSVLLMEVGFNSKNIEDKYNESESLWQTELMNLRALNNFPITENATPLNLTSEEIQHIKQIVNLSQVAINKHN